LRNSGKKKACRGVSPDCQCVVTVSRPKMAGFCVGLCRGTRGGVFLLAGSRRPRLGPNASEGGELWRLVANRVAVSGGHWCSASRNSGRKTS
jgi:hypothetical protein